MKKDLKFHIEHGVMEKPYHQQLAEQDVPFDARVIDKYEQCFEGLTCLRMNNIITETVYAKILEKLNRKIVEHVVVVYMEKSE